ncbi:unnamed protein product [Meganyctiphanes norvegica]|uniref:SET domain-containing protein 4 n=1 Tax=Meganyctiphanes norvegica TaxID=48144 RepID=A0AAV2R7V7_MEGNR
MGIKMDFDIGISSLQGDHRNEIQEENSFSSLNNEKLCNKSYNVSQNSRCQAKGRTGRRRQKRRKCDNLQLTKIESVDSDPILVHLCQWLSQFGFRKFAIPEVSLKAAVFSETGRGLQAIRYISQGSKLVSIPKNALVTCRTVVSDPVLGPLIRKTKKKIRAMDVLTLFLVYHKNLGKESPWFPYIASLPKEYSVPLYCTEEETNMLPKILQDTIERQYEDIKQSEENFKFVWEELLGNKSMKVQRSDIIWGWFTVNTRAVYLENECLSCDILNDKDVYALAPYLDLLNHTHTAEVTAGLNPVNSCYEIITQVPYKRHEQVFINYGPHDNLKLYTEYGFILPDNPHANIPVNFRDLITVLQKFQCDDLRHQIMYEKTQILKRNEMLSNICVSRSGPSWTLEAVVSILLMTPAETVHWQEVYNDLNNMVHRSLVVNFLKDFVFYLLKIWKEIEMCLSEQKDCSVAFTVSKELVRDYCSILELCLEKWFSAI